MKKILVLTDLTDNSRQAIQAAVMLSAKMHANLVLFNSFISQPVLSEFGGTPWAVEELIWQSEGKEKLAFLKENTAALIDALPPGDHHAHIDCRQGMGGLGHDVKDLMDREPVEMIIMGARSGSVWDHILMGSDTNSVIGHANRPVILIPAGHPLRRLQKVTIATDFDEADLNAVHYLTRLGHIFNFSIEIVHVTLWGKKSIGKLQHEAFEKQVAKFNYPGITFLQIRGKELVSRLNALSEENGSDLLVFVHDRHSLLDRLFHVSQSKSLLEQQQCPVMIIPAKMETI